MLIKLNNWEKISESSIGTRRLHRCVYANGYIYLTGGLNGSTTYGDVWRSSNGIAWLRINEAAEWTARCAHRVVYFGGKFLLVGGSTWNGSVTTYYKDVWSSVDGVIWELVTDSPGWGPRHEFTLTEHDGKLWMVGGFGRPIGYGFDTFFNDVWYTEDGETWLQAGSNFPLSIREHVAASFGGKLLVLGGDQDYSSTHLNTIYSTVDGLAWTLEGTAEWVGRREHQIINSTDSNKLVVVGGTNSAGSVLQDVWESSDGINWTEVSQINPPPARYDFGFVYGNNISYIIGGTDLSTVYYDDVWIANILVLADFYADKTLATPGEKISFFDASGSEATGWLWDFGDGNTSTKKDPVHTYKVVGSYDVVLTVSYASTSAAETKEKYITIYSGTTELVKSYPDTCFKHAVKNSQGRGISPISGTWVWPALVGSVAKGFDLLNNNITLVLDAQTMQFYRIGVPECWVDRQGGYDETEIQCEAMLPEIVSGEDNVRHIESKLSVRPWDEETYRGASGYTAAGLRDAQEISVEAYKGGEQIIPETTLTNANAEGDYSLLKEVEARRFQLKFKFAASAFRVSNIITFIQKIANRTPPQNNFTEQKTFQKEASLPDMWFARNRPSAYTNKADGEVFTGAAAATTGPDGRSSGTDAADLTGELLYCTGDFTIMFWVQTELSISFENQGLGNTIVVCTETELSYENGTDVITQTIDASSWIHIAVVRSSGSIKIYVNGALVKSASESVVVFGGEVVINGNFFDLRRISLAVTAEAINYYYNTYGDFV